MLKSLELIKFTNQLTNNLIIRAGVSLALLPTNKNTIQWNTIFILITGL